MATFTFEDSVGGINLSGSALLYETGASPVPPTTVIKTTEPAECRIDLTWQSVAPTFANMYRLVPRVHMEGLGPINEVYYDGTPENLPFLAPNQSYPVPQLVVEIPAGQQAGAYHIVVTVVAEFFDSTTSTWKPLAIAGFAEFPISQFYDPS